MSNNSTISTKIFKLEEVKERNEKWIINCFKFALTCSKEPENSKLFWQLAVSEMTLMLKVVKGCLKDSRYGSTDAGAVEGMVNMLLFARGQEKSDQVKAHINYALALCSRRRGDDDKARAYLLECPYQFMPAAFLRIRIWHSDADVIHAFNAIKACGNLSEVRAALSKINHLKYSDFNTLNDELQVKELKLSCPSGTIG